MSSDDSFESILNREFRWPKKGDRPFTHSQNWEQNAYIDRHVHSRLVMMMSGYKKGADLMVERAKGARVDRDALVFPIVFNYRQFIELSLKYLIATYGPTVEITANWETHDLDVLWKIFMQVLDRYGHTTEEEADPAVAEIIAEFAKVDPYSFSYRYPVDKKGRPIPLSHEEIDLVTLADVMNAVDGYFSGCDGYLDDLQGAGP